MLIRNKSLAAAAIGSTVLAVTLLGLPSQALGGGSDSLHSAPIKENAANPLRSPGYVDSRALTGTAAARAVRHDILSRTAAQNAYFHKLGMYAQVDIDPLTGTPRQLTRLNGFLTGRSSKPARTVALDYVRSHAADLGLTADDLSTFRLRDDYVDTIGVHHISWTQQARGIPVFGNGLKVNVTARGQVVSVQGSPVSGLAGLANAVSTSASVSASSARVDAAKNVHSTVDRGARVTSSRSGTSAQTIWSNHDYAKKVWFLTPQGLRLGWSTYVQAGSGSSFQHVVDASSGKVLLRLNLTRADRGDANVYDNYPGAAAGGKPRVVNFIKRGWLSKRATFLKGNSTIAFTDVNDDNAMQNSEKTKVPGTKSGAQFKLTKYGTNASGLCADFVCTWNPNKPFSWQTNRQEFTTNGFYFNSNFHDYLAKKPIGFTTAAGNFSTADGDPVLLNTLDGANTDGHGMPDLNHIDNANMSTPPDGLPPTMQMYLFHVPFANDTDPFPAGDNLLPTTGSLDASVQYHEYTHGLSNRLVVDPTGNEALNTIQAGSMGEAWSDYYATDYLVTKGFLKDTAKPGQLLEGAYVAAGSHTIRTMAIDCPVGAVSQGCTSGFDPSVKGGYTYDQFGSVIDGPEVHASGEIWGQTLWDIRTALGHNVADTDITRAMSLSPTEPSFLDMRNAIIQADNLAYGGAHAAKLWKIFAHRGMGYFAGAIDGGDTDPAADFHTPPSPETARTDIFGTVTDPSTGQTVNGAVVYIAGLGSNFAAVTHDGGKYDIPYVFPGTYPKVVATGAGYLQDVESVDATLPPTPSDFSIPRDWAEISGGAQVYNFTGADFTPFACGPDQAFDGTLANGWLSSAGDDNADPTGTFIPKEVTVELPQAVNISQVLVDPLAGCGVGGSASTRGYTIETSPDANDADFQVAATGAFTSGQRGQLNEVTLSGNTTNVKFLRFTIESNGVPDPYAANCPDGPFLGCQYAGLNELVVLGSAN